MDDFNGSKLAILVGDQIVTILRDDFETIPWPDFWDLPGGMREPGETPEACALRETREELGLRLTEADLHWNMCSTLPGNDTVWFFVSEQPGFDPGTVCFGDEGQDWKLAPLAWFLDDPKVIPYHKERIKTYLNQRSKFM